MLKKRVNIYPRGPITTVEPPIRTITKNVSKSIADIWNCLIAGAKVEEIINTNGQVIELNLTNYCTDNGSTVPGMAGRPDNAEEDITYDKASEPILDDKEITEEDDNPKSGSKHVFVPSDDMGIDPPEKYTPPEDEPKIPDEVDYSAKSGTANMTRAERKALYKAQKKAAAKKAEEETPVETKDPEEM